MSPKPADPAIRTALVEAAARLITSEGLAGFSLRRLTREVGTSTMAVYTHFGSVDELRREVRREGFHRLRGHLHRVGATDDPVADLVVGCWAYYRNATENPNLYRAMFTEVGLEPAEGDVPVGADTFAVLVGGVQRCIDAGRFDAGEALPRAVQIWALLHGLVMLGQAQMLGADQVRDSVVGMARSTFRGFGDDPASIEPSLVAARERLGRAVEGTAAAPAAT